MISKSVLRRWAVQFADRADEQNEALDHDELHAASDVCIILSMNPTNVTPYIERWLRGLTQR